MNLNQYDRAAFVKAVMDDVPAIDYSEIARKKVVAWSEERMPASVKKALKDSPEWFAHEHLYTPNTLDNISAYAERGGYFIREAAPALWADLIELSVAASAQYEKRHSLAVTLRTTIDACRTLKQATERLPEFEKYLPQSRTGSGYTNLPVANLVAELNAAGWPKGK